jgi:ribosome recycling factor
MPPLTEERRRDLAKVASGYAENAKIAVRNVRRDAMDKLKKLEKDGDMSEDEQKAHEMDVQKATDEVIKTIDDTFKSKSEEIMQV